jgi:hypothetical protein
MLVIQYSDVAPQNRSRILPVLSLAEQHSLAIA